MRLALVTLFFAVWAALCWLRPVYGSGLLIWVDIFAPLEIAYSAGAYPFSKWAFYAMLLSLAINVVFRGYKVQFTFFFVLWVLIMAWSTYTAWVSPFQTLSWPGLERMNKYLFPILIASMTMATLRDVKFLAATLAMSIGIWGAQLGIGALKNGVNKFMQIPGTQMGDNNFIAAAVVAAIPVLVYFAKAYNWKFRPLVRVLFAIMLFLCLCTVVFSNSRGAALGVVGNILIYLVFISKRRFRDWSICIILGFIVAAILPQSFYDRLSTLKTVGKQDTEASAGERLLLVKSTIKAIGDYPINGVGPYSWVAISSSYTGIETAMQPHNIWLKCGVELGLPGLFLFCLLVFGTIIRLLIARQQAIREKNKEYEDLAVALASSLIGYTISLTFLSNYDLEYQWAWLAVGNALIGIWNKRVRV